MTCAGRQAGQGAARQELPLHRLGADMTDAQVRYALGDVTHLRVIYDKLAARIDEAGRMGWVTEEFAALLDPRLYEPPPEEAWRRLKVRSRDARFVAIVRALAAWRGGSPAPRPAAGADHPRRPPDGGGGQPAADGRAAALAATRPAPRPGERRRRRGGDRGRPSAPAGGAAAARGAHGTAARLG